MGGTDALNREVTLSQVCCFAPRPRDVVKSGCIDNVGQVMQGTKSRIYRRKRTARRTTLRRGWPYRTASRIECMGLSRGRPQMRGFTAGCASQQLEHCARCKYALGWPPSSFSFIILWTILLENIKVHHQQYTHNQGFIKILYDPAGQPRP